MSRTLTKVVLPVPPSPTTRFQTKMGFDRANWPVQRGEERVIEEWRAIDEDVRKIESICKWAHGGIVVKELKHTEDKFEGRNC